MSAAPIHLAGERLMLDPAGALHWPARKLLAVADLHLEKGTSGARHGNLLPPWDTKETLDRLALLVRRYRPEILLALGDSFHDTEGAARLPPAEVARLAAMAAGRRLVWVLGNHDPDAPAGLAGESMAEFALDGLVFRHEAVPGTVAGEISGHFHPKARVPARAADISRPCFVADGRRVILPAFGAFTGGLDVRDHAISRLFRRGGRVFLLGRERLFSFPLAGPA
jgi:DNA ligase-associated metallophosphoesterase